MKTLLLGTALAFASSGLAQETTTATTVAPEATIELGETAGAIDGATEGSSEATETGTERLPVPTEATYELPIPVRCSNPGDVALTFDDGPGLHTGEVVHALKKNYVNATFHVAKKMLGNTAMVEKLKEAMANGSVIGLRFDPTLTSEDLAAMSPGEFHSKLVAESEAIHYHFGVYPRFLRMPYGYKHLPKAYHDIVQNKGFIVTSWTIDSKDYLADPSVEDLVEIAYDPILLVDEESKEHFGQIEESFIVLHRDIFDIAPAVDAGIQLVKAEGAGRLRFVTLGECLNVDNVYKKDAEGQHGFVGPNGVPVTSTEPEGPGPAQPEGPGDGPSEPGTEADEDEYEDEVEGEDEDEGEENEEVEQPQVQPEQGTGTNDDETSDDMTQNLVGDDASRSMGFAKASVLVALTALLA